MKTALKITGFFVAVILLLSITIKDKTIFAHIYNVISPGTQGAQRVTESLFDSTATATKKLTKKLFENSVPKVKDSLKLKSSAPVRSSNNEPQDVILNEEKEELDELIKSHN